MHARMICCTWLQCIRRQLCAVLLCCVACLALPVSAAWADSVVNVHLADGMDRPIPNARVWLHDESGKVLAESTTDEKGDAVLLYFGPNEKSRLLVRAFKPLGTEDVGAIYSVAAVKIWSSSINVRLRGFEYVDVPNVWVAPRDTLTAEAGGKEDAIEVTPSSGEASDGEAPDTPAGRLQVSGVFNLDPRALDNPHAPLDLFDPLVVQPLRSAPATVLPPGGAIVGLEVRNLHESEQSSGALLEVRLGDELDSAASDVAASIRKGEVYEGRENVKYGHRSVVCSGGGERTTRILCPLGDLPPGALRVVRLVILPNPDFPGARTSLNARALGPQDQELARLRQAHPFINGPLRTSLEVTAEAVPHFVGGQRAFSYEARITNTAMADAASVTVEVHPGPAFDRPERKVALVTFSRPDGTTKLCLRSTASREIWRCEIEAVTMDAVALVQVEAAKEGLSAGDELAVEFRIKGDWPGLGMQEQAVTATAYNNTFRITGIDSPQGLVTTSRGGTSGDITVSFEGTPVAPLVADVKSALPCPRDLDCAEFRVDLGKQSTSPLRLSDQLSCESDPRALDQPDTRDYRLMLIDADAKIESALFELTCYGSWAQRLSGKWRSALGEIILESVGEHEELSGEFLEGSFVWPATDYLPTTRRMTARWVMLYDTPQATRCNEAANPESSETPNYYWGHIEIQVNESYDAFSGTWWSCNDQSTAQTFTARR